MRFDRLFVDLGPPSRPGRQQQVPFFDPPYGVMIIDNTAYDNGGLGIACGTASTVRGTTVRCSAGREDQHGETACKTCSW